eukprot:TRINITY_DN7080_c0_g1_i2.p1 TRINITY_DN7080_c0_g1~~TRINITY_DN7080_c0_g1_i2.p1  ORF type:complete len:473 (-),score=78.80 TRINITY_DN7080_c0_g1_i2:26-1444(-)
MKLLLLLLLFAIFRCDCEYLIPSLTDWNTTNLDIEAFDLAASATKDFLYIGGGYLRETAPVTFTKQMKVYDFRNKAWQSSTIQNEKAMLASASNNDTALFVGGLDAARNYQDVDGFLNRISSSTFAPPLSLSLARFKIASASLEGVMAFAGGQTTFEGNGGPVANVDIYKPNPSNSAAFTYVQRSLSLARAGLAATGIGRKIYFAGGWTSFVDRGATAVTTVDVYDIDTNVLVPAGFALSIKRAGLAAATVGVYILFAGGWSGEASNRVDIVDFTNLNNPVIRQSAISEGRYHLASTTADNLAFFGGGQTNSPWSNALDIWSSITQTWTVSQLGQARSRLAACTIGNMVVFAGGKVSDTVASKRIDFVFLKPRVFTSTSASTSRPTLSTSRPTSASTSATLTRTSTSSTDRVSAQQTRGPTSSEITDNGALGATSSQNESNVIAKLLMIIVPIILVLTIVIIVIVILSLIHI